MLQVNSRQIHHAISVTQTKTVSNTCHTLQVSEPPSSSGLCCKKSIKDPVPREALCQTPTPPPKNLYRQPKNPTSYPGPLFFPLPGTLRPWVPGWVKPVMDAPVTDNP